MDENTRKAAGDKATKLLDRAGIPYTAVCLPAAPKPQADTSVLPGLLDKAKGSDFILGVGSGVINDVCKMLGLRAGVRTGIIATAPSMDGYASNSSAMIVDGVKTTLYNHTPALVLGDLSVLTAAPAEMLGAGIGDMAAKAISIAEWRIANIVTGEYYCQPIAEMMLTACAQALKNGKASMNGDRRAISELTGGLILSGIAMSMAQVSRPASGSEHTLSHLMDMLAIARHTPHQLHGVQVGYGIRVALLMYEALVSRTEPLPAPEAVLNQFDEKRWEADMRRVFGTQAEALMKAAKDEGRNTREALRSRARKAHEGWGEIKGILQNVLAQKQEITAALDTAGIPLLNQPQALGLTKQDVLDVFLHTKDLRARYIVSAMVFDLGLLPWMRDRLMNALGLAQDRQRYFDRA